MCEGRKRERATEATLPETESSCSTDALVNGTGSTRAATPASIGNAVLPTSAQSTRGSRTTAVGRRLWSLVATMRRLPLLPVSQ